MNEKGSYLILLLIITLIPIYSCMDQEEIPAQRFESQDEVISEAKYFFENQFTSEMESSATVRQGHGKRKQIIKNLIWDKAYVKHFSEREGVIIPVQFDEELYLHGSEKFSLSNLTYVIIYENEKGNKSLEVVTTFPDSSFLAANDETKQFSGIVYVEDWNGKLLKSIAHKGGRMFLYEPDEKKGAGNREAFCEKIVDWYSCSSSDDGRTWSCHYDYTEVTFEPCDNGGESSSPCTSCFEYEPATGTDGSGSNTNDNDEDLPEVCRDGYKSDGKGGCIKIIEACNTDNTNLNHPWFQQLMKNIWGLSNANDTSIPLDSRSEDGGWLVDDGNGNISFVRFPDSWIRMPCGIDPPDNWVNDIPDGAFSLIHSHPFYEGENPQSVCGGGDPSYTSGPSEFDRFTLLQHEMVTGYFGFIGYIIDGSNISIYTRKLSEENDKIYSRCGY